VEVLPEQHPIALRRLGVTRICIPTWRWSTSTSGEVGFELAEQLKRARATSELAVILVSTDAESDLAEMIEASPAVGFLQKFSLSPDAIRDLLKGHRASR
jgi:CheY-like chemotaxis protein